MAKNDAQVPVPTAWALALLSAKPQRVPSTLGIECSSVGDFLKFASALFEFALLDAQEAVDQHPLSGLVLKESLSGPGKLLMLPVGCSVELVAVPEGAVPKAEPRPVVAVQAPAQERHSPEGPGRKWASELPSLEDLREQAATQGVDISDLGRNKKLILARIKQPPPIVRRVPTPARIPPEPPTPPKRVKTAPALGPVQIVEMPEPTAAPPKPARVNLASIRAMGEAAVQDGSLDKLLAPEPDTTKADDNNIDEFLSSLDR